MWVFFWKSCFLFLFVCLNFCCNIRAIEFEFSLLSTKIDLIIEYLSHVNHKASRTASIVYKNEKCSKDSSKTLDKKYTHVFDKNMDFENFLDHWSKTQKGHIFKTDTDYDFKLYV